MSEHEGKDVKKVTEGQWTTGLYDCFSEDIPTCNNIIQLYNYFLFVFQKKIPIYYSNGLVITIFLVFACIYCYKGCFTWFCPCVAFGRIAEILDKGETGMIFFILLL